MVNHAQDLMSVKIFFVLPNKLIPTEYHPMFFVQLLASANEPIKHGMVAWDSYLLHRPWPPQEYKQ